MILLVAVIVAFAVFSPVDVFAYLQGFETYFAQINAIEVVALIVLSTLNWFLEASKWRISTKQFVERQDALRGFVRGLVFIAFSPSRQGQFIGRLSTIPKRNWRKAIYANAFIASLQVFVTFLFGLLFLTIESDVLQTKWKLLIAIGCIIYVGFLIYFRKNLLINFTIKDVAIVCGLSALRYTMFLAPYILLLRGDGLSVLQVSTAVSIFFLINALTPFGVLGELGKREVTIAGVFMLIFGTVGSSVHVSLLVWFFNILLPSVVGGMYWLKPAKK